MAASQISSSAADKAEYVEKVISWNVKMLLASKGLSQNSLAKAMGIRGSSMSVKLKGSSVWSVPDLIVAADFLKIRPEALMDDDLMRQIESLEDKNTVVADVRPRYFVLPVPPVGLEPTTHDLKGHCSNNALVEVYTTFPGFMMNPLCFLLVLRIMCASFSTDPQTRITI